MVFQTALEAFPGRIVYYSLIKSTSSPVDYSAIINSNEKRLVAINADLVCGLNHLITSCMKVINREELGKRFISGNINRELIYCLSPTKNLKEAMKLFSASSESEYILLASLECEDDILSFLKENHLEELDSIDQLSKEKSETIRSQLISHFGITEEELSIYPLADLVQMGVGMKNV